ncbi:MAG TPA: FliH/SctL family protein [Acidobacteriota bacterium]|nr:FliH/SctL family protein [Acidobacteriota bacterium]
MKKYSFSMIGQGDLRPEEPSAGYELTPDTGLMFQAGPAGESAPAVSETDLTRREKKAFDDGFAQGMRAGEEAAERRLESVLQRYSDTIAELKGLKKSYYSQVEREVVALAVEVAKKIVHREISVDQDIIRTLVRVALSHVTEKTAVIIHLNPVDYNFMMKAREELSKNESCDVALVADNSIQQGGCIIQTDCGEIDARIDEKFREVEHAFFEGCK